MSLPIWGAEGQPTLAVLQVSCPGCLGGAENPRPADPSPPGTSQGSRELVKVHLQPALVEPQSWLFPAGPLAHWQVSRRVWFSPEAILGTRLPRDTPGRGTAQAAGAARAPRTKAKSLLFRPHPSVARAGFGGARSPSTEQYPQAQPHTLSAFVRLRGAGTRGRSGSGRHDAEELAGRVGR